MQLSKFIVLSIAALFSSSGEACKCYGTNGKLNNGATHKCCNDYHGVYSGNDCKASSISEHLSGFDRCCKGQGSDCDFPRRAAALGQEMRAVKHVEIKTALANNQDMGIWSGKEINFGHLWKIELKNLGVGTDSLDEERKKLHIAVEAAAGAYATAKMASGPKTTAITKDIYSVHQQIESPVDYLRSEIRTIALANDTMNIEVEYFSFDSNSQNSAAYSAQIASYVSGTVSSVFGAKQSMRIGNSASRQVSRQVSSHSIGGTLVLSVSCTHKNTSIVAPFVLHVDKAIKVWNHLFPGSKLDTTSGSSMMNCTMNESQEYKERLSIISGVTYGASFVGMVHVLDTTSSSASESMVAAASQMQSTMNVGAWFAKQCEELFSQQNIQSHVTVLSVGVIPSMVAREVATTVSKFNEFFPSSNMANVATMQNAISSDQYSVQSMAEASRTTGQASEMQSKKIESSLSALATIDGQKNKILDGAPGIPINYYLKNIDQMMLAQMWAAKYYPGEFMAIKYDDTEGEGPAKEDPKAKL
ncbi:hypothetical protein FMEXI_7644 [Fusarium mexicanum]|uniref:Uncharacterized protein n=1 Tax=Fusarium mexicanum TaxID=751941 RepID=A0A8H5IR97_9HYPO|nr:hypothetical protein FMEXI_7644 [Fusarium mexicanum]